jgi:aspartyl protease family protein
VSLRFAVAAAAAVAALALLAAASAAAQTVLLAGRMGERALLVVDGRPHTLAVGASAAGVRLLGWRGDEAEVQTGAGTLRLRLGAAPAQLGATAAPADAGRSIVIPAGSGGHFLTRGAINGRSTQFMVDTGAMDLNIHRRRTGVSRRDPHLGARPTCPATLPTRCTTPNA